MKLRIYYAAPLHKEEDQKRNAEYAARLRKLGYSVYLPQEVGVWEDLVRAKEVDDDISTEEATKQVREELYYADRKAIDQCQVVVAYFGNRTPSEGGLWEMGYAVGKGKPVVLYNPDMWKFNLMPQYGSLMCDEWSDVLDWLEQIREEILERMKGWFI